MKIYQLRKSIIVREIVFSIHMETVNSKLQGNNLRQGEDNQKNLEINYFYIK